MSADYLDPAYDWRKREAEARVIASNMADPDARKTMLAIAEGYRRLADRAEFRTARQLIEGASFGPEALKAIWEAFDGAWTEVAPNFAGNANTIEVGRYKLATALLSVATQDSREAKALKKAALLRMALDYHAL
jgi:hypothetical protein